MQIQYDTEKDLLYIRLDERKEEVINRRPSEDIIIRYFCNVRYGREDRR